MERLIIRVDASIQIGTGHLVRCQALGQAWKNAGGQVTFITACQDEGLLQQLREEQFDIHLLTKPHPDASDWNDTKGVLAAHPDAWVVLDGYHFDEVYQQQVKETKHRLLVIDDVAHLKHYHADILLNQNLGAEQLSYSGEPDTRWLLGTRYALLRREFLAWREWRREIPAVARRVLVTLGGGDAGNNTLKVIQALQKTDIPGLEANVVVGASNPHAAKLEAAARQSRIPIRLAHKVKDMAELMAQADVAVSSSGSTVWELLFLGTPTLLLVSADNQRYVAEHVENNGAGKTLGWAKNLSVEPLARALDSLLKDFNWRVEAVKKARQIVDGQGAQRVITAIKEAKARGLSLRKAEQEDCRLLWEWANDPLTREASFSTKTIPWEDHVRWFGAKLSDPSCYYYILTDEEGTPIGQVRFDVSSAEAEVSVSIAPNFRGYTYGANGIRLASQHLFKKTTITRIHAYIKPDNNASIHAFTEASYKTAGMKVAKGQEVLEMVLDKEEVDFE